MCVCVFLPISLPLPLPLGVRCPPQTGGKGKDISKKSQDDIAFYDFVQLVSMIFKTHVLNHTSVTVGSLWGVTCNIIWLSSDVFLTFTEQKSLFWVNGGLPRPQMAPTKPPTGQNGGNLMPASIPASVSMEIFQNHEKHMLLIYFLFPAPWCGIAIGTWVRTYRDSVGVRSCS